MRSVRQERSPKGPPPAGVDPADGLSVVVGESFEGSSSHSAGDPVSGLVSQPAGVTWASSANMVVAQGGLDLDETDSLEGWRFLHAANHPGKHAWASFPVSPPANEAWPRLDLRVVVNTGHLRLGSALDVGFMKQADPTAGGGLTHPEVFVQFRQDGVFSVLADGGETVLYESAPEPEEFDERGVQIPPADQTANHSVRLWYHRQTTELRAWVDGAEIPLAVNQLHQTGFQPDIQHAGALVWSELGEVSAGEGRIDAVSLRAGVVQEVHARVADVEHSAQFPGILFCDVDGDFHDVAIQWQSRPEGVVLFDDVHDGIGISGATSPQLVFDPIPAPRPRVLRREYRCTAWDPTMTAEPTASNVISPVGKLSVVKDAFANNHEVREIGDPLDNAPVGGDTQTERTWRATPMLLFGDGEITNLQGYPGGYAYEEFDVAGTSSQFRTTVLDAEVTVADTLWVSVGFTSGWGHHNTTGVVRAVLFPSGRVQLRVSEGGTTTYWYDGYPAAFDPQSPTFVKLEYDRVGVDHRLWINGREVEFAPPPGATPTGLAVQGAGVHFKSPYAFPSPGLIQWERFALTYGQAVDDLRFIQPPQATEFVQGYGSSLSCQAEGGVGALNYSWERSSHGLNYYPIEDTTYTTGTDSPTLVFHPGGAHTTAWYRCVVADSDATPHTSTSEPARLTVHESPSGCDPLTPALADFDGGDEHWSASNATSYDAETGRIAFPSDGTTTLTRTQAPFHVDSELLSLEFQPYGSVDCDVTVVVGGQDAGAFTVTNGATVHEIAIDSQGFVPDGTGFVRRTVDLEFDNASCGGQVLLVKKIASLPGPILGFSARPSFYLDFGEPPYDEPALADPHGSAVYHIGQGQSTRVNMTVALSGCAPRPTTVDALDERQFRYELFQKVDGAWTADHLAMQCGDDSPPQPPNPWIVTNPFLYFDEREYEKKLTNECSFTIGGTANLGDWKLVASQPGHPERDAVVRHFVIEESPPIDLSVRSDWRIEADVRPQGGTDYDQRRSYLQKDEDAAISFRVQVRWADPSNDVPIGIYGRIRRPGDPSIGAAWTPIWSGSDPPAISLRHGSRQITLEDLSIAGLTFPQDLTWGVLDLLISVDPPDSGDPTDLGGPGSIPEWDGLGGEYNVIELYSWMPVIASADYPSLSAIAMPLFSREFESEDDVIDTQVLNAEVNAGHGSMSIGVNEDIVGNAQVWWHPHDTIANPGGVLVRYTNPDNVAAPDMWVGTAWDGHYNPDTHGEVDFTDDAWTQARQRLATDDQWHTAFWQLGSTPFGFDPSLPIVAHGGVPTAGDQQDPPLPPETTGTAWTFLMATGGWNVNWVPDTTYIDKVIVDTVWVYSTEAPDYANAAATGFVQRAPGETTWDPVPEWGPQGAEWELGLRVVYHGDFDDTAGLASSIEATICSPDDDRGGQDPGDCTITYTLTSSGGEPQNPDGSVVVFELHDQNSSSGWTWQPTAGEHTLSADLHTADLLGGDGDGDPSDDQHSATVNFPGEDRAIVTGAVVRASGGTWQELPDVLFAGASYQFGMRVLTTTATPPFAPGDGTTYPDLATAEWQQPETAPTTLVGSAVSDAETLTDNLYQWTITLGGTRIVDDLGENTLDLQLDQSNGAPGEYSTLSRTFEVLPNSQCDTVDSWDLP